MDQWYYALNGRTVGPVAFETLRQLAASGQLHPVDLVWREGMPQWVPLSSIAEFGQVGGSVTPGGYRTINYSSSAVLQVDYAGFWLRVVAYIIDSIILGVAGGIIGGVLFGVAASSGAGPRTPTWAGLNALVQLFSFVGGWLYSALMESSTTQATLGKMALGIRVTDLQGNRISFGQATGRHFGKIVSGIILCIGFLMVAFTEKKQGLHDMMAGTLVVKGA